MTELETVHADYLQKKAEIEHVKLTINKINHEIQDLNKQISEHQAVIEDIKGRLENSAQGLVPGELSSADCLALKQTLRQKEALIVDLLEIVGAQEEEKIKLSGTNFYSGLKNQIRILALIKCNLVKQLSTQYINNISTSAKDEIKDVIKLISVGEKHMRSHGIVAGDDIYRDIGKTLCDAVFPLNAQGLQEVTFIELKKDVDAIVERLA